MANEENLRNKTIGGVFWKICERSLAQIINFVVSIVLARILLPESYGIVALIMVFITICDKLVSSGFATSLIQKKDADNLDFSTVFYFSIVMSIALYAVLYFFAPLIASFYSKYERELLINVTRVIGLKIIVSAINSVQHAFVSKTMQFKRLFLSTVVGAIVSASIGIIMAYNGFGVWALVAQTLTTAVIDTTVLWFAVRWRPQLKFSFYRLKGLFAFGWKILAVSIIRTLYNDLRSIVIGKFYQPKDLAYYNKGYSFPQLIDTNISGTIDSVMFPAMAKKQSDSVARLAMLSRSVRTSMFFLVPILVGLAAVARPFVLILLGPNWEGAVPFLEILCFSFVLEPVVMENQQAIKAIGRSGLLLKLEIFKKIVGIGILFAAIPFGVLAIAMSTVVNAVFVAIVNAIASKRVLGYSFRRQIKDLLPALIFSSIMFAVIFPLSFLNINIYLLALIQIVSGIVIYVGLSALFKVDSLGYVLNIAKGFVLKKKSNRSKVEQNGQTVTDVCDMEKENHNCEHIAN